ELEAVPLIEPDGPGRRGPGADEHPPAALTAEVLDEGRADAVPLVWGQDVGVANEVDVVDSLDPHHTREGAVLLEAPECTAGGDLPTELLGAHVRLVPRARWNHALVRLGRGIDDLENRREVFGEAQTDVSHSLTPDLLQLSQSRHRRADRRVEEDVVA